MELGFKVSNLGHYGPKGVVINTSKPGRLIRFYGQGPIAGILNEPLTPAGKLNTPLLKQSLINLTHLPGQTWRHRRDIKQIGIKACLEPVAMERKTWTEKLANGAKIIFDYRPETAKIEAGLAILGAGPVSESKNQNGLAHLLEHLICAKHPGALTDARTSHAFTYFGAEFLTYDFSGKFSSFLEGIFNPRFSQKDITAERQAIERERKSKPSGNRNPYLQEMIKALWGEQPLTLPIMGTEASLTDLAAGELSNFLTGTYTSGNTILLVSGKFLPKTVREIVQNKVPLGQRTKIAFIPSAANPARIRIIPDSNPDDNCLTLGSKAVTPTSKKDLAILKFIQYWLGGPTKNSAIFQQIRSISGQVFNFSAGLLGAMTEVALMTDIYLMQKDIVSVLDKFLGIIEKLGRENMADHELATMKEELITYYQAEGGQTRPSNIALNGQFDLSLDDLIAATGKIKADDVREMAAKIFQLPDLHLATMFNDQQNWNDLMNLFAKKGGQAKVDQDQDGIYRVYLDFIK